MIEVVSKVEGRGIGDTPASFVIPLFILLGISHGVERGEEYEAIGRTVRKRV